jgi:arylsulfatase A-like enzyme
MVPHIDILPTLLETCGVAVPAVVQGRSFAPLLNGTGYTPRDHFFAEMTYHDYYDPMRCIRTETHKLIVYFCYNVGFMDPSQSWRPKTITKVPPEPANSRHALVELYDLEADPLEHHNLANDAAHAATRDDLLRRLYAWMVETNDPLLQGIPPSPMHLRALETLRNV